MTSELLPAGTEVDLDSCAREPIHLAGAIQPRGVLLVVGDPDLVIQQASANTGDLLGVTDVLGRPLAAAVGDGAARAAAQAVATFRNLRERNPIEVHVGDTLFDLILHRTEDGRLLVELESADGPRPLSFQNTYLAVRTAVEELNRAATLDGLYQVTADHVRALTGFDRVMVYRYDDSWDGEVVAEAKRDDLNTFLGLHYPASDIPAQARALYEKNWIRLISDVGYTPVPLLGVEPLAVDLTYSTLRSVSPIHLEYLHNMGVRASMSISLLRDGVLWGLVVCHHYAGPNTPPYAIRAAAEFLASTLSLRLLDRYDDEAVQERLRARSVLADLVAASREARVPLVEALTREVDLRSLIPADDIALRTVDGVEARLSEQQLDALLAWARAEGGEVVATDRLAAAGVDLAEASVSGALVVLLPDDQALLWLRDEATTVVDWGGDPHNKAIATGEGADVRLSPRKSFERWREVVRGRSAPWTAPELELAAELRRHLIESLYARSREAVVLAESVQRSLLPTLPDIAGWAISARYEPAAGGRIGGDWYDAFPLPDGRLAVVLGDVAGHGVEAAGQMAQLRNAFRAYLFAGRPIGFAVTLLNRFALGLMPGTFATLVVLLIDPAAGRVEAVSAGHPTPYVVGASGVRPLPVGTSPPLGAPDFDYAPDGFELGAGDALVLFSDGLIERKGEDIDAGLARIVTGLGGLTTPTADDVFDAVTHDQRDDVTVLVVSPAPR